MSYLKIGKLCACASVVAMCLSGCNTIRYWWQYYDGNVETSLREPTGYYEHAVVQEKNNKLVIPAGLSTPVTDNTLTIPTQVGMGQNLVGDLMDVRAPIVPYRSDLGIIGQYNAREAIIWFSKTGAHGIYTEQDALALIKAVLADIHVPIQSESASSYEIITALADYNEYGQRYDVQSMSNSNLRYSQIYKIRIGRAANGNLGIATALLASKTMLANGRLLQDTLSDVELQRFATGFANQIIGKLAQEADNRANVIDDIVVTLGTDNNDQSAFVVNAPTVMCFNVIKSMLPKYEIVINEYSISSLSLKVEVKDDDADIYRNLGVDPFLLAEEKYIIRLAQDGDNTLITFYDEDDKPLSSTIVNRLYPGFSSALMKEFVNYNDQGLNYSSQ